MTKHHIIGTADVNGKWEFQIQHITHERANRTGINFSITFIIRRPNCKIDRAKFIKKKQRVVEIRSTKMFQLVLNSKISHQYFTVKYISYLM